MTARFPRKLGGVTFSMAVVIAIGAGCVPPAYAEADPDWGAKRYDYVIVDQDLRTTLDEYGRNIGVRVSVSPAVQGRVKGEMPRSSARAFLDALARAYGLDWYYDGFSLYVSTTAEARSHVLELQGLSFEAVLAGIKNAGLDDPRFRFRPGPTPSVALVSGPPRYIESLTEIVEVMAKRRRPAARETILHVYHGAGPVEKLTFSGSDLVDIATKEPAPAPPSNTRRTN